MRGLVLWQHDDLKGLFQGEVFRRVGAGAQSQPMVERSVGGGMWRVPFPWLTLSSAHSPSAAMGSWAMGPATASQTTRASPATSAPTQTSMETSARKVGGPGSHCLPGRKSSCLERGLGAPKRALEPQEEGWRPEGVEEDLGTEVVIFFTHARKRTAVSSEAFRI